MEIDLSELNAEQKEAVLYNEGPLAILSCAGSGKTRCLVSKISYLVNMMGVKPYKIWACTFTTKAAEEMKERLHNMIGPNAAKLKISTIHSLAYRIWLGGMSHVYPWFEKPSILFNEGKALSYIYQYIKKNDFLNKDAKQYLDKISNLKLEGTTPEDLKRNLENNSGQEIRWSNIRTLTWTQSLYLVYKVYEDWKAKENLIDFQDMLLNCYKLLENKNGIFTEYIEKVKNSCEFLLIDEAQDTNKIAFEIIKIVASKYNNITLVGDVRQSIYSFQGAEIENINMFIKNYNPKIIELTTNYRSTKTIVDNANKLISYSNLNDISMAVTPNDVGEKIEVYGNHETTDEGFLVLDLINRLRSEGAEWRDIAILYRIHSQSREVEDQFVMNDIPYVIYNKTSFYDRKEIKDLLSYLEIVLNPKDCQMRTFKRIANRPVRFIENGALESISKIAKNERISPYEVMTNIWSYSDQIKQNQISKIEQLMTDINMIKRVVAEGKSTSEIFIYILDKIGYKECATDNKHSADHDSDIELNFESLVTSVKKFETPIKFIEFIDKLKQKQKAQNDPDGDFIKMMSIHASKGKEFKYVILLGVCDRIYPFHRSISDGNHEEERRIMYVALTRPKHKLFISTLLQKYGRIEVKPSPYLSQMNIDVQDTIINDSIYDYDHEFISNGLSSAKQS